MCNLVIIICVFQADRQGRRSWCGRRWCCNATNINVLKADLIIIVFQTNEDYFYDEIDKFHSEKEKIFLEQDSGAEDEYASDEVSCCTCRDVVCFPMCNIAYSYFFQSIWYNPSYICLQEEVLGIVGDESDTDEDDEDDEQRKLTSAGCYFYN